MLAEIKKCRGGFWSEKIGRFVDADEGGIEIFGVSSGKLNNSVNTRSLQVFTEVIPVMRFIKDLAIQ